jgi:hypothetical protein
VNKLQTIAATALLGLVFATSAFAESESSKNKVTTLATFTFDFSTLLSSTSANLPTNTKDFATLTVTELANGTDQFSLKLNSFNEIFGSKATISAIKVDLAGTNASTFGDNYSTLKSWNDGTSSEKISWTTTNNSKTKNITTSSDFALLINGITIRHGDHATNNTGSGWYSTISPVPEPTEGALLLSGLGLMGFIATRRKNNG